MLRNGRSIRIYVRNKDRYNIDSKKREFLYIEVADFAGTTIGEVKENVQRQCGNSLRLDALYLNNQPLANDRSVAHYNLEDETILETTSNPFWVSCLYVKAAEVKQLQQGRPDDDDVQKWTQKSLPKKYVLISLLFNSKNEFKGQPPHFPSLDDFVLYLEQDQKNKKGATMHPDYTQKDLRAFEREFRSDFMGRYDDPLAAFLDHHAVRLGYLDPEDIEPGQQPIARPIQQVARAGGRGNAAGGHGNAAGGRGNAAVGRVNAVGLGERQPGVAGRRKEQRACDDCEDALAEVYCTDCPGGLALCRPCSAVLHAGATRRRHTLQDVAQAPKVTKPYVPRAFLAPFAIVVAMYSAMTDGRLSVMEEEIKRTAQSLTDTDLQDKQHGKYVGGFDCMENVLITKGFVQKEAARVPTYALTETGQVLGEKLFKFYKAFYKFSQACRLPKVTNCFRSCVIGNRQLCLLIDERERDRDRLLRFAAEKQIGAQVRMLPAGDYVWILTPPMVDPHLVYTGKDYDDEQVLPFVVERKSWEDLGNSAHTARFQRQVNTMLGSGIKNCFYLVEGSASGTKYSSTHHQQDFLKSILEKLTTEQGFYVNYTSSWMKSAQWLLWFSSLILEALRMGHHHEERISYTEYMSRAARQHGAAVARASFTQAQRHAHKWTAQLFIDHIFRDSLHERSLLSTVQEDLRTADRHKHMLIIENLQQYNKRRQSTLSKCSEAVHANPDQATEIVEEKIGPNLHNMVHYDIPSYWQLYIQVIVGVYVVRTESDQERERIQQRFLAGPQDPPPPPTGNNKKVQKPPGKPRQARKKPTATVQSHTDEPDRIFAGQLETDKRPVYNRDHLQLLAQINRTPRAGGFAVTPRATTVNGDKSTLTHRDQFRRKAVIHTIDSVSNTGDVNRLHDDGELGHGMLANGGQPDRSEWSRRSVDPADRGGGSGGDCTDKRQLIQPFSGRGFCLGSSGALETSSARDNGGVDDGGLGVGAIFPTTTRGYRDRNPGVGGMGGMATSGFRDRDPGVDRIAGLLGGTRDREISAIGEGIVHKRGDKATDTRDRENNFVDDTVYRSGPETCGTAAEGNVYKRGGVETVDEQSEADGELGDQLDAVPLDAEDFINSQNEDDVLNQILTKSAAEVQKTSNEDQMYRLALELSRKEATIVTTSVDKEEDLLQKVIEQSKREANAGRSVIHPGHRSQDLHRSKDLNRSHDSHRSEEPNRSHSAGREVQVNSPNKIVKGTEDDVVVSHDDDEDEMIRKTIELSKRTMTPVKKVSRNGADLASLPEDEQVTLALERSLLETKGVCSEHVSAVDEKAVQGINTRRAVKRKITGNEAAGSSHGDSAIVVEDEDKSGNVTEDEEVGKVAELGKQSTTGNAEDIEMREALERSLIEHSPRKKSRRNYDRELSQAIERSLSKGNCDSSFVESKCDNSFDESPESDAGEDLKLELDQSMDNHSPRKKTKLGTKGTVTPINKPIALSNALRLTDDSRSPSSKVVEKANLTKTYNGNRKDSSFCKFAEVESCEFTSARSDRKSNRISDTSSLRLVMQEHDDDLMSRSIDEKGANVNELIKEEDSDTEDLVPPSPDKLSQSLTTKRNRSSILSDFSSKETSKQREQTDKANTNKNRNGKENKSKSGGFDLRSSLFGTSDSSDNESDYESDENIFEDEADVTGIQHESVNSSTKSMLACHKDGKDKTVALEIKPKKNNCEGDGYVDNLADTAEETVDVELEDTEYDCEDDNDIDYQPGTQELINSHDDEDNDNDSDIVEDDLSDDILPVIRGPRSKLYKDLKAKEEKLLQQKLTGRCSEDNVNRNKEDKENREVGRERHHDEDFEIARLLQEELNREHLTEGQIHAFRDDEWNKPLKENATDEVPTDDVLIENDEEYARRLQAELDSGLNNPTILKGNQREHPGTGNFGGDGEEEGSDELVRELQRRELEKIERMKKSLERDESLAKELQNLDAGTAVAGVQRREDITSTQASYKQHVAVQKTGKEQTLAQLRQYRRDQMERYHNGSDTAPAGRKHVPAAAVVDLTHEQDNIPWKQNPDNFLGNPNLDWEEQWFRREDANTPFTQREAGFNQSQATVGGALTQPDQSQSTVGGHLTQSSQSQGSNITCGNCGGKGHTRKFVQCSRYHTAEETARREEKVREDRRKKEMKAVQEKIKQQINAEKDEKKKQEMRNMEAVVMSAEMEFQTTMNQLRNIIQQVEHLSGPDPETTGNTGTKPRRKQRKK